MWPRLRALLICGGCASVPAVAPVPANPTPEAEFHSSVRPLTGGERNAMIGVVWREGCPVQLDELVHVEVGLFHSTGEFGTGVLVVHRDVAKTVTTAFGTLWALRFPIARMEPMEVFGGDDNVSMTANNSSGFNCRPISGGGRWSEHAMGTAVDINPLWNPFVRGERVLPEAGRKWAERRDAPGQLLLGSPQVRAFTDLGWGWGGKWTSSKDWQHVSLHGT